MVKTCCISNCKSEWNPCNGITFHCFPKDPEKKLKWLNSIPVHLLKSKLTKYSFICSRHFSPEVFKNTSRGFRNFLDKEAFPTLFSAPTSLTELEFEHNYALTWAAETDRIERDQCILKSEKKGLENVSTLQKPLFMHKAVQVFPLRHNVSFLEHQYKKREHLLLKHLNQSRIKNKLLIQKLKSLKSGLHKRKIFEEIVKSCIARNQRDLVLHEYYNSKLPNVKKKYSEAVKKLALNVYRHSPDAYNCLREKVTLPHSTTIKKWMKIKTK